MRGKRYSAEEIVNKPGILILSMLHWNSPINIGSVLGIATWIPGLLFVPACFLLGYDRRMVLEQKTAATVACASLTPEGNPDLNFM